MSNNYLNKNYPDIPINYITKVFEHAKLLDNWHDWKKIAMLLEII